MKAYIGTPPHQVRVADLPPGIEEAIVISGSVTAEAQPLHHVVLHSPTGLSWGYGGSGPADLALSILADALGEKPTQEQLQRGQPRCWKLHQAFKWQFVAKWPQERPWMLPQTTVLEWVDEQLRASPVPDGLDATP